MTATLIQLTRIPEGLQRVPLERAVTGESAMGASYVEGATGFIWMDSTHGREGWHWDSQDFSHSTLTIRGPARTFYFQFQDARDQGWFNLRARGPNGGVQSAWLTLPRLGKIGDAAFDLIAVEFNAPVERMTLQVETTGGRKSNGYAVVGLHTSPSKCPDRVKK